MSEEKTNRWSGESEQVLVLPMDLTGSGGDDLVLCSLFEDRWTVRVWVRD